MTTHHAAGDPTLTAKIEVGSGPHQYLRLREWGVPPAGTEFGKISAVAVDSKDRVYVYQRDIAEQGIQPMVVLDREGVAIDSWGRGDIIDAHGLHITKSDELLAVDRDGHRVVKFTLAGDIVMVLGGRPSWQAPFNHPTDVAVGPSGDIYITDGYCNSSVHHFSAAGDLVESWGGLEAATVSFVSHTEFGWTTNTSTSPTATIIACNCSPCQADLSRHGRTFIVRLTCSLIAQDIYLLPSSFRA